MAAHSETEYTTADGNDYAAHESTYENFVLLLTVGICHVINICIGLAIGGVKGVWWACAAVIIVASLVAVHGLITGAKTPSYVMVVLSLLALAAV